MRVFSFLYTQDYLKLHTSTQDKSDKLSYAIQYLQSQNHCFTPTLFSCHWLCKGNIQTLLDEARHCLARNVKYSRREAFKLSDGGTIFIDYMGEMFYANKEEKDGCEYGLTLNHITTTESEEERPVLFVAPGLTSHSQTSYIKQIVLQAQKHGFDVVVINYRGLAGAKLTTDRIYTANSYEDLLEPMEYVYDKYCRA